MGKEYIAEIKIEMSYNVFAENEAEALEKLKNWFYEDYKIRLGKKDIISLKEY